MYNCDIPHFLGHRGLNHNFVTTNFKNRINHINKVCHKIIKMWLLIIKNKYNYIII